MAICKDRVNCTSDSLLLMDLVKLVGDCVSCHCNITKGLSFPMAIQFHDFWDFPGILTFLNILEKRNITVDICFFSQNRYDNLYRGRRH